MLIPILCVLVVIHIIITWVMAIRRGRKARRNETIQPPIPVKDLPPVSVIVPAWREKGTIEGCIEALKKVEYPLWEVLIMAGGNDDTYNAAIQAAEGDAHFRVIERGPEPKNVVIMRGVAAAQYDILVLLDADSIVFPNWLSQLVQPIALGAAASFGMHYPLKETWISLAERIDLMNAYYVMGSTLAQGCSSQAIRRGVLERIGPLPVDAYSWEDWDIDIRLLEAGETNFFAQSAQLLTERPFTLTEFWNNAIRSYRSHLAGLWYYRRRFWQHPTWGFFEILFYLISTAVFIMLISGLVLYIFHPEYLLMILQVIFLSVVWVCGRRAALAATIAAFTNDLTWLGRGWSLIVLLPIQFTAAVIALLGAFKQPRFDYKGQRQSTMVRN